jgi:D-amino-acid dehydrogenase
VIGQSRSIIVIGAGIVGLSVALALQERGETVTLVGDDIPGRGASIWNAGVLATSSLLPMSNPAIYGQVPAILSGKHPGVRVDWGATGRVLPWALRFLRASRGATVTPRVRALSALITRSAEVHANWLARAQRSSDLVRNGWMFLFRSTDSLDAAKGSQDFYREHDVSCQLLSPDEVGEAEPVLVRRYAGALLFKDTAAVREPAWVMDAYLALFLAAGGSILRSTVTKLWPSAQGEGVLCANGARLEATDVVVATGARSRSLLAGIYDLPMISERGYALRLSVPPDKVLYRPVYDAAVGVVLSPRPDGIQVSTGTYLTTPDRPTHHMQAELARRNACKILDLPDQPNITVHHGDRPTLPDGLPVVGRMPGRPGLWLATGHQHIGFSTSAGTAELLADLLTGRSPKLDPNPFRPERPEILRGLPF